MSDAVKIYHNPRCSKSRDTLSLLKLTVSILKSCSTWRRRRMQTRSASC